MKLFESSKGFVFAFGFDMLNRRPDTKIVQWCDPVSKQWGVGLDNEASEMVLDFDVEPEFVREADGRIVAYQPGLCLEFTYVGYPMIWEIKVLKAENSP